MQATIKQRPIPFSTAMAQAILEGRKTMTRRKVKQNVPCGNWEDTMNHCLYGKPGDILWVREEHYRYGHWERIEGKKTPTGKQKWQFVADYSEVRYCDNPPAEFRKGMHNKDPHTPVWYKRLARFMPYTACRLFLRITDIRVERLQDISEEDAISEGVTDREIYPIYPLDFNVCPTCGGDGTHTALGPNLGVMEVDCTTCDTYKNRFKILWENIHNPESWHDNPWVWVVSFERINKPE